MRVSAFPDLFSDRTRKAIVAERQEEMLMDLYVAPHGNDNWSGALPEPNKAKTDGPLATLPRVLDRLQTYVQGRSVHPDSFRVKEPPAGPITVYLRGGVYSIE